MTEPQTVVMVPISDYERMKKDAESTEFWREQSQIDRAKANEAHQLAIFILRGAGGSVTVTHDDLWSIKNRPDQWELLWGDYDGLVDPLANKRTFAIKALGDGRAVKE